MRTGWEHWLHTSLLLGFIGTTNNKRQAQKNCTLGKDSCTVVFPATIEYHDLFLSILYTMAKLDQWKWQTRGWCSASKKQIVQYVQGHGWQEAACYWKLAWGTMGALKLFSVTYINSVLYIHNLLSSRWMWISFHPYTQWIWIAFHPHRMVYKQLSMLYKWGMEGPIRKRHG